MGGAHITAEYPQYAYDGVVTMQMGKNQIQFKATFTAPNLTKPVVYKSVTGS